jgi:hypothetical protein
MSSTPAARISISPPVAAARDEAAHLHEVGTQREIGAAQRPPAVHDQHVGADAVDARSHLRE